MNNNSVIGTTKTGFSFDVDKENLDNMELLEALNEMEENPVVLPSICIMILGKDGKRKLYDHLRDEKGRVPVSAVVEEIKDIFEVFGQQGKNS